MSNDVLTLWMISYIQKIKGGVSGTRALADLGISLDVFSDARINNEAFAAAIDVVQSGVGATIITADELLRLRQAQVSEMRTAAYFGKTVEEFRDELERDEALRRVYETGVGRGQALIQMAQFDAAISGDPTMLKHTGVHVLDQKEKVTHEVTVAGIDEMIAKAEALLGQKRVQKQIEGTAREIRDE